MAADDSKIKITTEIDPTGAQVGGDQVIDKVRQVEKETHESAEKLNVDVLGNLRSVHHLVGGLIELGEGGTAAIGGLAAEGRVATEVFEGMLGPLAPILLVLTTITQIAIPMVTHAIEEHRKKEEEAVGSSKKDLDDYAGSWRKVADTITESLGQILQAQQAVTKEDEKDLSLIKQKASVQKAQATLDEKAAIERLRAKYIADQSDPNLTEEQRKNLKKRFEAEEADIKDKTTVNTAEIDRQEKEQTVGGLQKEKDDQQAAIDRVQKTADSLFALQQLATAQLAGLGLIKDDGSVDQEKFNKEAERRKKESDEAQARYQQQLKNEDLNSPTPQDRERYLGFHTIYKGQNISLEAYREQLKKEAEEAEKNYRDLSSYGKNANLDSAIKKANEELDKAREELAATVAKIPEALTALHQATQAADQARVEAKENAQQRGIDQGVDQRAQEKADALKKAKEDYDLREAQRYAQEKSQQAIIDNPNASADAKAAAKAAQDRIAAAGKQDQLDHAGALGLTPAEVTKLRADLGLDKARAADAIAGQQKKDQVAEQKQDANAASEDIKRSKAQIDALGNKDASKEAAEILRSVADRLVTAQVAQAELHALYMQVANGKFQEHDAALQQQQRAIDQLKQSRKNNHQS
jgi:hypothetical protein